MEAGDINIPIDKSKNEKGKFNNIKRFNDGNYIIFSLGHSLKKISEGTTVSYANDINNVLPFKIFSYEHQGGANILFYTSPKKYNHGYIVIDGGFTNYLMN